MNYLRGKVLTGQLCLLLVNPLPTSKPWFSTMTYNWFRLAFGANSILAVNVLLKAIGSSQMLKLSSHAGMEHASIKLEIACAIALMGILNFTDGVMIRSKSGDCALSPVKSKPP